MAGPLSPATDRVPDRGDDRHATRARSTPDAPDRQVLVVGDDLAAAATAGFLEQAGLDPVFASAASERARSSVVTIWQPGLALLERIGLRRPVERTGTRLDDLDCLTTGQSWTADTASRPSLVAIRRSRLRELLAQHLRGRIRTTERPVRSIEPTGAGARATFEQGIEEPFDTVVTTDRSLVRAHEPSTRPTGLHVWEFEWPSDHPAPDGPTEAWAETLAAFTLPVPGGTYARLVSVRETSAAMAVSTDELADRFGRLFDAADGPFAGLDDGGFEYRQVPRAVPTSLCLGHAALVGPGARAPVPGSGLGASFGVEDAWVVADALAYGPASVDDALATYEDRRQQRMRALCPRTDDGSVGSRIPTTLSPPLRRLCAARTLAFSHVVDGQLPELARDVPESL